MRFSTRPPSGLNTRPMGLERQNLPQMNPDDAYFCRRLWCCPGEQAPPKGTEPVEPIPFGLRTRAPPGYCLRATTPRSRMRSAHQGLHEGQRLRFEVPHLGLRRLMARGPRPRPIAARLAPAHGNAGRQPASAAGQSRGRPPRATFQLPGGPAAGLRRNGDLSQNGDRRRRLRATHPKAQASGSSHVAHTHTHTEGEGAESAIPEMGPSPAKRNMCHSTQFEPAPLHRRSPRLFPTVRGRPRSAAPVPSNAAERSEAPLLGRPLSCRRPGGRRATPGPAGPALGGTPPSTPPCKGMRCWRPARPTSWCAELPPEVGGRSLAAAWAAHTAGKPVIRLKGPAKRRSEFGGDRGAGGGARPRAGKGRNTPPSVSRPRWPAQFNCPRGVF